MHSGLFFSFFSLLLSYQLLAVQVISAGQIKYTDQIKSVDQINQLICWSDQLIWSSDKKNWKKILNFFWEKNIFWKKPIFLFLASSELYKSTQVFSSALLLQEGITAVFLRSEKTNVFKRIRSARYPVWTLLWYKGLLVLGRETSLPPVFRKLGTSEGVC